jgi:hypothetical protein
MLALLGVLQQIQLVNISHLRKVLRHHPASLVQVLIG